MWRRRLSDTSSCATNRSPENHAPTSSYPDPAEMGEKSRAVRVPQPVPPGIFELSRLNHSAPNDSAAVPTDLPGRKERSIFRRILDHRSTPRNASPICEASDSAFGINPRAYQPILPNITVRIASTAPARPMFRCAAFWG